jgi:tetratricopeptide (TPR) repeat protein
MRKLGSPTMIEPGSLPTPDNPNPSNQIVQHYVEQVVITTPPPDEKVLAEYRQAIADYPKDAGLRLNYAHVLRSAGDLSSALEQIRAAVSIAPESENLRAEFASLLSAQVDHEQAVAEFRESLRLTLATKLSGHEASEALTRWGLAEVLQSIGRSAEARAELPKTVEIEQVLVSKGFGSRQFLGQLSRALRKIS